MSNFQRKLRVKKDRFSESQPILMHIDLDMFYASVEILNNPELRGKPLVVGNPDARNTGRGVVLTASYEARKYGIHSGMPMIDALKRHRRIVISNSARKLYKPMSEKVMRIFEQLDVPMLQTSIDEAYLELTGKVGDFYLAYELAESLQNKVYEETGLTVSIGVGPTLKVAKIASDYRKPKGITVVTPDGLEQFFTGMKLTKIPGIGSKTGESLKEKGFELCDELFHMSREEIILNVGRNTGEFLHNVFHGLTSSKIVFREQQKSISHESTFHGKSGDLELYHQKIDKLFGRTYEELTRKNYITRTVNVKIRFTGFETITRARSLPFHTAHRERLRKVTFDLISPYLLDERGIRLLGVGFSQLEKDERSQLTLDEFF